MRTILFTLSMLITSIPIISSTNLNAPKPALFPNVKQFYDSVQSLAPNTMHNAALNDISQAITTGIHSDKPIALVFTCSDNSFRSVAAQIVLESMLALHKYNKLLVSSCGFQNAEINSTFINVLSKHGFQVEPTDSNANGKKSFDVKFGESLPTVSIYAKQANDQIIPKMVFMQVKMCNTDESVCSDLPAAKFKESLSFNSPISEEEMDKEFSQIAAEILYAFNKTQ